MEFSPAVITPDISLIQASMMHERGNIYRELRELRPAMEDLMSAKESLENLLKSSLPKEKINSIHSELAWIYQKIGYTSVIMKFAEGNASEKNAAEDINYLKKSLDDAEIYAKNCKGWSHFHLGYMYAMLSEPEKALGEYDLAIQEFNNFKTLEGVFWASCRKGSALIELGKCKEAEKELKRAYNLEKKKKRDFAMSFLFLQQGKLKFRQNDMAEAKRYFEKSLKGYKNKDYLAKEELDDPITIFYSNLKYLKEIDKDYDGSEYINKLNELKNHSKEKYSIFMKDAEFELKCLK
jgi:tetratricopeptide (TPR) repeat protein